MPPPPSNAGRGFPWAVLRAGRRDRWLAFAPPREVVAVRSAAAAPPALAEVAARADADGLWAVGWVAYEAAPGFDPALRAHPPAPDGPPLLLFGLCPPPQQVVALPAAGEPGSGGYELGDWRPSLGDGDHRRAVAAVHRHIARGRTYQVNLTYRLRAPFRGDPAALFRDLAAAQGGTEAAWIDGGRHAVGCASPELFFDLRHGVVTARPMKGTAPRGRWGGEDRERARALAASEKERAENLMIVDMVRNDLGRVAEPGTVAVPHLFRVERYPTLWQMTSTVTARTAATVPELFAALFPCASITGAPKASTSGIITRLEDGPRGIYTGAVGYLAPGGEARFSVAIRTAVVDRRRGEVEYGVGGGIVWDSRPDREAAEARLKARVLTAPPAAGFELLETLLWTPVAGFFLLAGHLDRLAASADYFGYPYRDGAVRRALEGAVRDREGEAPAGSPAGTPLRVRLLLAADGGARAEASPLAAADLGTDRPQAATGEPLPVALAAEPVDADDPLLFHKTTRRSTYDRALAEVRRRRPEAVEVILWNRRREVTEAATANLVVELDGALVTPPLECGLLPGVLRRRLVEEGEVEERPVPLSDLARSDGLWLVNSVRRWRRAQLLEG